MRSEKGRRHVWGPEGLFLCHLFPWSKKSLLCLSSSQLGFPVTCIHKNPGSFNIQTKASYSIPSPTTWASILEANTPTHPATQPRAHSTLHFSRISHQRKVSLGSPGSQGLGVPLPGR